MSMARQGPRGAEMAMGSRTQFSPGGDHERQSPASTPHGPVDKAGHVARILIVEDELFVAWHLESLVRDLHYDVCGLAADGENAFEQANDFTPDLILMDIRLSGQIDGVEAARRIREKRDVAMIFITAYNDDITLERIRRIVPGAQVLAKPVSAERLRMAISAALEEQGRDATR